MFVLGKALSAKKKVVYNKEQATKGYDDLKKAATEAVKTPPAPSSSPALTTNSDPAIVELTKQLANLTLIIQANMNILKTETTNAPLLLIAIVFDVTVLVTPIEVDVQN